MLTVRRIVIDSIRRESWGKVGWTGLFCKGAEHLIVQLLEVSVSWGRRRGSNRRWRHRGEDGDDDDCLGHLFDNIIISKF